MVCTHNVDFCPLFLFRDVGHFLYERDLSNLQSGSVIKSLKYKPEVGTHIIHETLATKDVGEEARGILDV